MSTILQPPTPEEIRKLSSAQEEFTRIITTFGMTKGIKPKDMFNMMVIQTVSLGFALLGIGGTESNYKDLGVIQKAIQIIKLIEGERIGAKIQDA